MNEDWQYGEILKSDEMLEKYDHKFKDEKPLKRHMQKSEWWFTIIGAVILIAIIVFCLIYFQNRSVLNY